MHCTLTISPVRAAATNRKSSAYPLAGVEVPEPPGVPALPNDLSCASRSFCSRASARRLRKSESWTRPTVCDLSRSSAVAFCDVKRAFVVWFGVEPRDAGSDGGFDMSVCGFIALS